METPVPFPEASPAAAATPRQQASDGGKTLILHIGSQKTGSSSLQHFLRQHAAEARKRGINFVRAARPWIDHNKLARELRGRGEDTPLLDEVLREIETSPHPLQIISAEELFHPRAANRLAKLLPKDLASRTWIMAYLRRPDDLMESLYKQRLKTGAIEPGPMRYLEDAVQEYDYLGALDAYRRGFGEARMIVRPYRRDLLERGDGIRDFLHAAGMADFADLPRQRPEDNPTFSAALSELMGVYAKGGGSYARLNEVIAAQAMPGIKRSGDVFQPQQRRVLLESLEQDFDRLCEDFGEHLRPVLSVPDFEAETQPGYPTWREWSELHHAAGLAITHALTKMQQPEGS